MARIKAFFRRLLIRTRIAALWNGLGAAPTLVEYDIEPDARLGELKLCAEFRPVLFCQITASPDDGELHRLHIWWRSRRDFELCQAAFEDRIAQGRPLRVGEERDHAVKTPRRWGVMLYLLLIHAGALFGAFQVVRQSLSWIVEKASIQMHHPDAQLRCVAGKEARLVLEVENLGAADCTFALDEVDVAGSAVDLRAKFDRDSRRIRGRESVRSVVTIRPDKPGRFDVVARGFADAGIFRGRTEVAESVSLHVWQSTPRKTGKKVERVSDRECLVSWTVECAVAADRVECSLAVPAGLAARLVQVPDVFASSTRTKYVWREGPFAAFEARRITARLTSKSAVEWLELEPQIKVY